MCKNSNSTMIKHDDLVLTSGRRCAVVYDDMTTTP